MTSELLFVYGSLKRGARHHEELEGAPFVGVARTTSGYSLEALPLGDPPYSALVETPGAGVVEGELFEVRAGLWEKLDAFEGDAYLRGCVRLEPLLVAASASGQTREICFALAYLKRTR